MQEKTKQTFSAALEAVKQLLTLSTGVLALTVTFKEKVLPHESAGSHWLLVIALICTYFLLFVEY